MKESMNFRFIPRIIICFSIIFFISSDVSAQLKPKNLMTITGENSDDYFGYSVSTAGDVNGDGISDLIVGTHRISMGEASAGRAYIFFGSTSFSGSLDASQADVIVTGETLYDYFGSSVSSAGDVNGDGISDVIVGAPYYVTGGHSAGRAYIFYGSTSFSGSLDASQADVILTGEKSYNCFGVSVSTAGDVNSDGISDVIVGAYYNNVGVTKVGRVYIFYGGTSFSGSLDANQADVIVTGETLYDYFGSSVATAGDVNGDGISDVIVGAHNYAAGGHYAGRAYIFYGGASFSSSLDASQADVILTGENLYDYFGSSVSSAGDVNGDGISDVIVGTNGNYVSGYSTNRAYIFFGSTSFSGSVDASQADVIVTGENSRDWFGSSVSSAGDVNDDGISDVIVGAQNYIAGGDYAGRAYIFFGGASFSGSVDVSQADVIVTGENSNDHFGSSVSTAGDVNGDGASDLIVGAHGNNAEGRAYVFNIFGLGLSFPNGGEYFSGGNVKSISWMTANISNLDHIKILYSTDDGKTYSNVIIDNTEDDGLFDWTIPSINSNKVRVKVRAMDANSNVMAEDESDDNFTISSTITLTSPNGGEYWAGESIQNITWTTSGPFADHISILYSIDDGYTYPNVIVENTPNDSSYTWTLPEISSNLVKIKVQAKDSLGNELISDVSDSPFIVDSTPPDIFELISPISGEMTGKNPTLKWNLSSDKESNIFNYEIYIDNNLYQKVDKSKNSILVSQNLSEGNHLWKVIAVNNVNLKTTADKNGFFNVDIGTPNLTIINPINGSTQSEVVIIRFEVSDSGIGVERSNIYINDEIVKGVGFSSEGEHNWEWDTTNLFPGLYIIKIVCSDKAGNSTFKEINVNVIASGIITNGGFEKGHFTWWETGTTQDLYGTPVYTDGRPPSIGGYAYRGSYCALIGGKPLGEGAGPFYSWIKKTVVIPEDIISAKLSFAYYTYSDNNLGIQKGYYFIEGSSEKHIFFEGKGMSYDKWIVTQEPYSFPINWIKGKRMSIIFEVAIMAGSQITTLGIDEVNLLIEPVNTSVDSFFNNNLPKYFILNQNYPNPFNPETSISFQLPKIEKVEITIYNQIGQIVKKLVSKEMPIGYHEVIWDAKDENGEIVANGIYICKMRAGEFQKAIKMLFLK
jgi:flagellar hook assembly protein FlgD